MPLHTDTPPVPSEEYAPCPGKSQIPTYPHRGSAARSNSPFVLQWDPLWLQPPYRPTPGGPNISRDPMGIITADASGARCMSSLTVISFMRVLFIYSISSVAAANPDGLAGKGGLRDSMHHIHRATRIHKGASRRFAPQKAASKLCPFLLEWMVIH